MKSDATYLVTGGLRGIGLATAQWLVDRGARSLALLGRTTDTAAEAAVQALQAQGATVRTFLADVADRAALADVLAQVQASMPPLRGVFHSAGVTDDAALGVMAWPRVQQVMAPKVLGAWHLHELTTGLELDHFVLYSSLASLAGNAGQFNHIAACSFLDALASHRRHRGLTGVSINWGYWSDIGVATRYDLNARMARIGVGGIDTRQGINALQRLVAAQPTQCGAVIVDWARLKPVMFPTTPYRLLAELGGEAVAAPTEVGPGEPTVALGADLLALPAEAAKVRILAYLLAAASRILKLGAEARSEVERDFASAPLNQLGFDSLMAVEMRNRIRHDAGADVPLKHFLAGSSAGEVAELIYAQSIVKHVSGTTADVPDEDLETITI